MSKKEVHRAKLEAEIKALEEYLMKIRSGEYSLASDEEARLMRMRLDEKIELRDRFFCDAELEVEADEELLY